MQSEVFSLEVLPRIVIYTKFSYTAFSPISRYFDGSVVFITAWVKFKNTLMIISISKYKAWNISIYIR